MIVYGTKHCSDCHVARKTLDRLRVSYRWIDLGEHPEDVPLVMELNGGNRVVPTIVFADGTVLAEPSAAELTAAIKRLEAANP
ncbi:MAG: hypothetical protein NVS9B11_09700 [Candidatus Dormibacteraceae bacterium]